MHRVGFSFVSFLQRIQRGSQIRGGDRSVKESVDEPILTGVHHAVRQLHVAVFIA